MIASKRFIWLHVPKTGGHTVQAALKAAGVELTPEEIAHEGLRQRELRDPAFAVGDRVVVAGLRRLPHWILSRVHYEASRAPYRLVSREMLLRGEFFERSGEINRADDYAAVFDDPRITRWVRLENLQEDFVRHFGDLLDGRVRLAARKLRRFINPTYVSYIKDPRFFFTLDELKALYAANPVWAELERRAYGGLWRPAETTRTSPAPLTQISAG
jgi:hypothetical protein